MVHKACERVFRTRWHATLASAEKKQSMGSPVPGVADPSQTSLVVTIRQPLGFRLGPPCASTDPESSAGGCYLSRSVTPLRPDIANARPVQPRHRSARPRSRRLYASTLTRQPDLPHQRPTHRNIQSFPGTRLHGTGAERSAGGGRWAEAVLGRGATNPLGPAALSAVGASAGVLCRGRDDWRLGGAERIVIGPVGEIMPWLIKRSSGYSG